MKPRAAEDGRHSRASGFLGRAYGLDLRSLALWRAQDLRAFYTDWGVLPRAVLLERFADRWLISVHLLPARGRSEKTSQMT